MADLLTRVRREIDARLAELRPVVDEVRRLERARSALGTSDSAQRRSQVRRRSARKRTRMPEAQSRELDRQVLALLSRIRHSGRLRLRCCRRPRLRACVPGSSDSLIKERSVSRARGLADQARLFAQSPNPHCLPLQAAAHLTPTSELAKLIKTGTSRPRGELLDRAYGPTPESVSARRHGMSGARGA